MHFGTRIAAAMAMGVAVATSPAWAGSDTAFTYQGELVLDGSLVTDTADFTFNLFDAAVGGTLIGSPDALDAVPVVDGRFTVEVDLGTAAFNGERWLQIAVRSPAGAGAYTVLDPRQRITAAPVAMQTRGIDVLGDGEVRIGEISLDNDDFLGGRHVAIRHEPGGSFLARMGIGSTGGAFLNLADPGGLTRAQLRGADGVLVLGPGVPTNATISLDGTTGQVSAAGVDAALVTAANLVATDPFGVQVQNASDELRSLVGWNPMLDAGYMQVLNAQGPMAGFGGTEADGGEMFVRRAGGPGLYQVHAYTENGHGRFTVAQSDSTPMVRIEGDDDLGGSLRMFNQFGAVTCGIDGGSGTIWGLTKNFRIDNPRDDETDIVYASLEGPEAGAYHRGTARLVDGRAVIALPAHFQDVTSSSTITVHLTPRSGASMGLAYTTITDEGVVVEELQRGTGTYDFDFLIMDVRAGFEGYEVIRPKY